MEARKIVVVSTKTQSKTTINSSAETVKELIKQLQELNIDCEYMDFYEGVSKSKLSYNDSLPRDVEYKGQITNDLVIMLSTANKMIKSGALSPERKLYYDFIIDKNLQDVVLDMYSKNFTQCTNAQLKDLYDTYKEASSPYTDEEIDKMFESLML